MKPSITVGVVSHDGWMTVHLANFVLWLGGSGLCRTVRFLTVMWRNPVEWARNVMNELFVERHKDADAMLLIDADMEPEPALVENFLREAFDSNAHIIAAPYAGYKTCEGERGSEAFYPFFDLPPDGGDCRAPTTLDVETRRNIGGCGFGFTLIRSIVLNDPRMMVVQDRMHPFRFVRDESGCPVVGEDIDFCNRARKLGYEVELIPTVIGHRKEMDATIVTHLRDPAFVRRLVGGSR